MFAMHILLYSIKSCEYLIWLSLGVVPSRWQSRIFFNSLDKHSGHTPHQNCDDTGVAESGWRVYLNMQAIPTKIVTIREWQGVTGVYEDKRSL